MPQIDMQLVQWIAARLRYQPIPQIIGQTIQIDSLQVLEADLHAAISPQVPELGKLVDPELSSIKQTLAKHHVIDLTFQIEDNLVAEHTQTGIDLLNDLGFMMNTAELEQFEYVAALVGDNFDDPTLLSELQLDLMDEQMVLRILLRDVDGNANSFIVVDACITNAASVWLHKHPYY